MTIGHIANSFLRSTANPDSASHDSQPFRCAIMDACCDSLQHASSVPNLSSPERVAQLVDVHQAEVMLSESGLATHVRAPTRAWADIARDADVLGREVQRSIDRYYKWLIEMCQRTADMDPGSSGERIGRLRRRRDREFNRLMYRYSALGGHDPRLGSGLAFHR